MSIVPSEWPKTLQKNGFNFEVKNRAEYDAYISLGWSVPYQHQDFPMAVHGKDGASRSVKNQAELEAALAEGFSRTPGSDGPEPAPEKPQDTKPHRRKIKHD